MNLREISDVFFAVPKIEWGLIHQEESLTRKRGPRNDSGGHLWASVRESQFRVFAATGTAHAEVKGEDLGKAVRAVLETLGLEVPKQLQPKE